MDKKLNGHRILIVNDDGVFAPGISLLEKLIRQHCDDVWVVAPDEERSGASHQVSMHVPIRLRQLEDRKFAVKGSPADCVLMALHEIMDSPPTLVLAGINRGPNLAEDAHYSGTIAVALEATITGIPAIALSQVFEKGKDVPWETAEAWVVPVIEKILSTSIPAGTLVNVNFPPVLPDKVSGLRVVSQGRYNPGSFKIEGRIDRRSVPYFWVYLQHEGLEMVEGTDLEAIASNAVAVSPLKVDMSDTTFQQELGAAFDDTEA